MKKIVSVIIIGILITCSFGVQGLFQNFPSFSYENHGVTLDISWKKHLIDDAFEYAFGVHAVDVDKDGDCDVLGAAQEGDFIAWWRNEGGDPISWTKFIIDDNFDGATSVFAVDIDGDLDIDVVGSAWQANEIALWINNGENPIKWTKHTIKSGFDFAHEVYCYDLDEDGDVDILGSSSEDHQINWWRNDGGDPISWTEQIIGNNFFGAKSARVADIDNDGLLDVIGAAILDNDISWWKNNGGDPINWEEHVIVDDFNGAHRVEVCDMDFDGDIDIVGAAYFEAEISWWRNDGGNPIAWKKQVVTSSFNGACIGLPVDIDDDGDIDIVGTAQQGYDVAVFRNDGGEPIEWTKIIIDTFFLGAWPGYVADIDSDGDIDIVAGASFADKLAWWESDLNQQPSKPETPSGPTEGKPGIEYTFETISTDPYGKQLYYMWSWGNENYSDWLGPYTSGEKCITSNIWIGKGTYEIKVKAKNVDGAESDWSDPLSFNTQKPKRNYDYWIDYCNFNIDCINTNGIFNQPVMTTLVEPKSDDFHLYEPKNVNLPDYFNWKDHEGKDWTTSAKNQGGCGSCWAFASVAALESMINIREGIADLNPHLSVQYILSCLSRGGCGGGTPYVAFDLILRNDSTGNYCNGIIPETCFPYLANDDIPCDAKCSNWDEYLIPIADFERFLPGDDPNDIIKSVIIDIGPVACSMNAGVENFTIWGYTNHDEDDYFPYEKGMATDHCVLIVGWKDDVSIGKGGYWICKNSWGPTFGYDGFFNIEYESLRIASDPYWVDYNPDDYDWHPTPKANGPYYGLVDEFVVFQGEASGENPPFTWHWDFGDGSSSNEQHPIHIYSNPGEYSVQFTVTDDNGASMMEQTLVWIQETNQPPSLPIITGPSEIDVGKKCWYNISFNDPDGSPLYLYFVGFGFESNSWWGPYPPMWQKEFINWQWEEEGEFIVKAKVKDPYGAESDWTILEVTVPKQKSRDMFNPWIDKLFERFPLLKSLINTEGFIG